jgi:hypothetical protein
MGDEAHYTEIIISCQGDSAGETWNHEGTRIIRIMQWGSGAILVPVRNEGGLIDNYRY